MTPYEIIEDIKSDRIKKVIFDGDTGADGDDQFALALALRSPKMNVVAANSAPFNDDSADMAAAGKLENDEIIKAAGMTGQVVSCCGSPDFITRTGLPMHSEAADNIIKICRESDEPVYIVISGCCTNAACALALAPDIADKLIVLWLGLDNLDGQRNTCEYNYHNDVEGGKLLFSLAKNMVLAVAGKLVAPFQRSNEQIMNLYAHGDELCRWLANRFCEISWAQGLWDYCADGVLAFPDAFTYEVVNTPIFKKNGEIENFDPNRQMVAINNVDVEHLMIEALKLMGVYKGSIF